MIKTFQDMVGKTIKSAEILTDYGDSTDYLYIKFTDYNEVLITSDLVESFKEFDDARIVIQDKSVLENLIPKK